MALTQSQIYSFAVGAGLSGPNAKIAAAVAMAESGGNPNAHNAKPPDDSYGLWQINMLGGLGPQRRSQLHLSSNSQLLDPKTNARAMAVISARGTNWHPWSTFNDGAYKRFLSNKVAVGALPRGSGGTGTSANDPTGAQSGAGDGAMGLFAVASSAYEVAGKAAVWLSNAQNWVRIAYVLGGGVVVVVGLYTLVRSTAVGQEAVQMQKDATRLKKRVGAAVVSRGTSEVSRAGKGKAAAAKSSKGRPAAPSTDSQKTINARKKAYNA
jgi:hypothetical protein